MPKEIEPFARKLVAAGGRYEESGGCRFHFYTPAGEWFLSVSTSQTVQVFLVRRFKGTLRKLGIL